MDQIKFLPIPAEEYDALEIGPDTVLETHMTQEGVLIVRALNDADMEGIICDRMCASCPVARYDCDEHCASCPCFVTCADSGCAQIEGVCQSHGTRREF